MTVASVTEISAVSTEGFEEAVREGIGRATSTLRNVEGAWVKDRNVLIEDGNIVGYKVNLLVTFVMEEAREGGPSGDAGSVPSEAPRSADVESGDAPPEAGPLRS